jgi:hypothetical protein
VSLIRIASVISDNAARATSREVAELRSKELVAMEQLDRANKAVAVELQNHPEKLWHAEKAYLELSDQQKTHAHKIHELGCAGHGLNLTVDDCYKKSEKEVIKQCMKDDKKTGSSLDVSNVVICVSKLFASDGDHASYYLNSYRTFRKWADDENIEGVVLLPSVKGSRQSINVELPAAILQNIEHYINYLSTIRSDTDPNKLVTEAFDGLRDKYVVAALRARTFFNATFLLPMRLFTHHNDVTRPHLHLVMKSAEAWIGELGESTKIRNPVPLSVDKLPLMITANVPELLPW